MKKTLGMLIVVLALPSARAQLFSPESLHGAFWGAMIGGAVGSDRHCGWSGDGAAIGAGIGFALGAVAGESRRQQYYQNADAYPPSPYGYRYANEHAPTVATTPTRPNYAVSGALVGAASGALIGGGASGHPGYGAAIGAGAGLILGSIAEHNARRREFPPAPVHQVAASPAAQSVRQPRPQPYERAPDAPRVPDAPTF